MSIPLQPKSVSQKEVEDFNDKRERQKEDDIANNVREKGGRSMKVCLSMYVCIQCISGPGTI